MEVIERHTPEWEAYVLSLFTKEELVNGHPKASGLMRVAQIVLGEIIKEDISLTPLNHGMACVYKATFYKNEDTKRERVGAADCTADNTDKNFAVYASALAETRARARCCRFALGLSIVAHDEISGNSNLPKQSETEKPIDSSQRVVIRRFAAKKGLDIDSLIKEKYNKNGLDKLTHEEALELIQSLNS